MNKDKTEVVKCNFCSSSEYKNYDTESDWTIVECLNCDFLYTNPRPTIESLPSYYEESYFADERHFDKFYNKDGTIKEVVTDYTNRIIDVESFVEKRGNVLDVGCARGAFLNVLKNRGWSSYGVEISQDAVNLGTELYGVDLFCGTIEKFETDKKFDVICMYQTLEHVPNPKEVVEKSHSLLNKNGVLVIEVPNVQSFDMKISKKRKHLSYDLPRHLNHFTPELLKSEIEKIGFEVVDINYYYPNFLLYFFKVKSQLKGYLRRKVSEQSNPATEKGGTVKKEKPLQRKYTSLSQAFYNRISKVFPGWRFTIIAKKKQ